ncbi:MAG: hypothetical protein K2V38_09110 [Gemmataceae bacterium]|nr:hypothetical protein [Gemmataceae bacterium]
MRNLLALIGLLVVGVGGGGWYLGWYKLDVTRKGDGNLQITTDVDTKRARGDLEDAGKHLGAVISEGVEKAGRDGKVAPPATAPGGTPGPVVPGAGTPTTPDQPQPGPMPNGAAGPSAQTQPAPAQPDTGWRIRLIAPKQP